MKNIVFVFCYSKFSLSNPPEYFLYKNKVKKYCEILNNYFVQNKMDYNISLDDTLGDNEQLIAKNYDGYIFLEPCKTRNILEKYLLEKIDDKIFYITVNQMLNKNIDILKEWLTKI